MQKNSNSAEGNEDENGLNYMNKKLFHMVELQIMDIQNSLHYIQKKHAMPQIKESLSQIYNIFNQTEPLFRHVRALFLHQIIKKLMNCFGIIYITLMEHIDKGIKGGIFQQAAGNKEIVCEEKTKKQFNNKEKDFSLAKTTPQIKDDLVLIKSNKMGGISLYNQNYARHISTNHFSKAKKRESKKQLSKQEFNRQVQEELNQLPYETSIPDENVNFFAFKFKYGRENSVVTFHDELQSISNFFRESQNQAFQFLNKTKDQNAAMSYDDEFQDTIIQMKIQKEQKMRQFAQKVKAAFRSVKRKTKNSLQTIQGRMNKMQQLKQTMLPPVCHEKQTQTTFNLDQELKSLYRKITDAEERYSIMVDIKRKEMEESLSMGMELQNQLGIKNREVVYLNLKIEEDGLVISSLNKRLKFLNQHRKLTEKISVSKQSIETNKVETYHEIKEQTQEQNTVVEEKALESIRKQRRMAKLMLLQRRRGTMVEEKSNFMKRFTQPQVLSRAPSEGFLQKWKLSEIAQNYHEQQDLNDSSSDNSNRNNLIASTDNQMLSRANMERTSFGKFNVSDKQISKSIHSIADYDRPTKLKKENSGTNSEIINNIRKQSFLNKIHEDIAVGVEESNFFEDSDEDNGSDNKSLQMSPQQIHRIEEMIKKQMNRTKENIVKRRESKKLSVFSQRRKTANQSEFSKQKNDKNKKQVLAKEGKGEGAKTKGSFRVTSSSSNKIERESPVKVIDHRRVESSQKRKKTEIHLLTQQDQPNISERSVKSIKSLKILEQKQIADGADEKEQKMDAQKLKGVEKVEIETKPLRERVICASEYNVIVYPCDKKPETIQTEGNEDLTLQIYQQNQGNKVNLKNNNNRYSDCGKGGSNKQLSRFRNKNSQLISKQVGSSKFCKKPSSSIHLRRSKENKTQAMLRYVKHSQNTCNDASESDNEQVRGIFADQEDKPIESNENDHQQQKASNQQRREKVQTQQDRLQGYQEKLEVQVKYEEQQEPQNHNMDGLGVKDQKKTKVLTKLQKMAQQRQEKQVKQLAMNCRTLQQFKQKISKLHAKKCGSGCTHLQKFVASFLRYRQQTKQKMRLHISNIHENISQKIEALPILRKKKNN